MALPNEIDKSTPGNNDDPSQGAAQIRDLKTFLEDLLGLVDATNYTVRIFNTGTSANTILNEAAVGATVAFDPTITFEAVFSRTIAS